MGGDESGPTGPRIFSSLFLAGKGLLAFQGLSRGDGLLNGGHDSPGRVQPERSMSAGAHG